MAEWRMSREAAAELLSQLEAAAKTAVLWDGGTAGSPIGMGFLENTGGEVALDRLEAAAGRGGAPSQGQAKTRAARRRRTAGMTGPAPKGQETERLGTEPTGGTGMAGTSQDRQDSQAAEAGGAADMAAVSRFFERDARRYG